MNDQTSQKRFIKLPEVIKRVSLSRSTIYERISRKKFPAPIPIGGGRVAWIESEVDQWIEEHISLVRRVSA